MSLYAVINEEEDTFTVIEADSAEQIREAIETWSQFVDSTREFLDFNNMNEEINSFFAIPPNILTHLPFNNKFYEVAH